MATGLPAIAAAAPKTGCPAEASGARELTVGDVAEAVYAGLLVDPYGSADALAVALSSYDRNGDDHLCLMTRWGADLNPKSHWYRLGVDSLGEPTTLFIVFDNNSNARK